MLHHLTAYLFRYKILNIPGASSYRLVQQSPELNVADRRIEPPAYTLEVKPDEEVSPHQLRFLQAQTGLDEGTVLHRLRDLGQGIIQQQQSDGFLWEGIGRLNSGSTSLSLAAPALQPVTAEKIIRQDAAHKVLVGDRHMTATEQAGEQHSRLRKRRMATPVLVAWVLLVLTILLIAVWLVLGKFKVNSAGSKLPVAQIEVPVHTKTVSIGA